MTDSEILAQFGPRESMDYDILIVGAGPAGLASAIHLKQLAQKSGQDITVAVLEKGAEPGAHILSGAIMDPKALSELFPNWREMGAPLHQEVTDDAFLFLTPKSGFRTPNFLLPKCFQNHGNFIVSLGEVTRWLAEQAESLGVEIFPGFSAAQILYTEEGAVRGVATGNMGVLKDGTPGPQFQLGMEINAKYTLLAEGARGHLGREVIAHFKLDKDSDPQSYGLGIKEVWEIDPERHQAGLALHSAGWPLENDTYGGSFLYHLPENKVAVGFIVGLDYQNPWLSPFEEFQRFKTHPNIRWYFEGDEMKGIKAARRLAYGARAIAAGGLLSLPKTIFAGGALIGCDAGYLNASRIKGSHAAIKSGMLAAQAAFEAVSAGRALDELSLYPQLFKESWLYKELKKARNFKQWFKKGFLLGTLMTGIEQKLLGGHVPWTIHKKTPDHLALKDAKDCPRIEYPKPDGKLSFDRLSSVFISNTNHEENQPAHLTLKDASVPLNINYARFAGPEARYCPAGVYEYIPKEDGTTSFHINAQNCVHCKTCDIKDPKQNIVWVTPEGGGGPVYGSM
jgi:electron-transferring-flavoprotein dehydrogenase